MDELQITNTNNRGSVTHVVATNVAVGASSGRYHDFIDSGYPQESTVVATASGAVAGTGIEQFLSAII